jgi:hypothetical protein
MSSSNGAGEYYSEGDYAEGSDTFFDDDDYFFRDGLLAYETRLSQLGEVLFWFLGCTARSAVVL